MAMPIINIQPAAQTVGVGIAATFSVVATLPAGAAGGIDFQWQRRAARGAGAFADITGATADAFTTPPTVAGNNGTTYRVRVTNAGDMVDSAEALLTVTPAAVGGGAPPAGGAVGGGVASTPPNTVNVNINGAGVAVPAPALTPTTAWPPGHSHVVTHVAPPRSFMTTNGEKNLLIVVIVLMVLGAGFVTWVITSRNEPKLAPTVKVVTCTSMCMEIRTEVGEVVDVAKKACEQICAPPPALAPQPAPAPAPAPAASPPPSAPVVDDYAACVLDLISSGASRRDAEKYCR